MTRVQGRSTRRAWEDKPSRLSPLWAEGLLAAVLRAGVEKVVGGEFCSVV